MEEISSEEIDRQLEQIKSKIMNLESYELSILTGDSDPRLGEAQDLIWEATCLAEMLPDVTQPEGYRTEFHREQFIKLMDKAENLQSSVVYETEDKKLIEDYEKCRILKRLRTLLEYMKVSSVA